MLQVGVKGGKGGRMSVVAESDLALYMASCFARITVTTDPWNMYFKSRNYFWGNKLGAAPARAGLSRPPF